MELSQQRNNYTYMVAAIILLAGVVRLPVDSMRALFALSFRLGVIVLFAVFLFENVNRWAGVLLALAVISHLYPAYSIRSYAAMDGILMGLGLYAFIVLKCSNIEPLLNSICVLTFLMVLFLAIQAFGIDPYGLLYRVFGANRVVAGIGLMANRNETSAFLALAAPAFYRPQWVLFIHVIVAGLYFARGFGGAAGFGLGLIVFAFCYGHHFWPMIALSFALAAWYFYIDIPGVAIRLNKAWTPALGIYKQHWLFGVGFGNWRIVYTEAVKAGIMDGGWMRLHNTFIQNTVEMGIGFIAITIGFFISIAKRAFAVGLKPAAMPLAALASIIAMMNVNSMFRINAINAMVAVVWLAILEIKLRGIHAG